MIAPDRRRAHGASAPARARPVVRSDGRARAHQSVAVVVGTLRTQRTRMDGGRRMNAAQLWLRAVTALQAGADRADNACSDCTAYATLHQGDGLTVLDVHHDDDCPTYRRDHGDTVTTPGLHGLIAEPSPAATSSDHPLDVAESSAVPVPLTCCSCGRAVLLPPDRQGTRCLMPRCPGRLSGDRCHHEHHDGHAAPLVPPGPVRLDRPARHVGGRRDGGNVLHDRASSDRYPMSRNAFRSPGL